MTEAWPIASDERDDIDELSEVVSLYVIGEEAPTIGQRAGAIATRIFDVGPSLSPEVPELSADQGVRVKADTDLDGEAETTDPMRLYLNQIGKYDLLTAEEEVTLAKSIEAGMWASQKLAFSGVADRQAFADNLYEWKRKHVENLDKKASQSMNIKKESAPEAKTRRRLQPVVDDPRIGKLAASDLIDYDVAMSKQPTTLEVKDLEAIVEEGRAAQEKLYCANLRLVVSVAKRYRGVYRMDLLDLIQEGNLGLRRAVEKFDYTRGYKFSTYSTWWIKQGITRAIAHNKAEFRLPARVAEKLQKVGKVREEYNLKMGDLPTTPQLAKLLKMKEIELIELQQLERGAISLNMLVGEGGDSELLDFVADDDSPSELVESQMSHGDLQNKVRTALWSLSHQQAQVIALKYGLDGNVEHTNNEIAAILGVSLTAVYQSITVAKTRLKNKPEFAELKSDL